MTKTLYNQLWVAKPQVQSIRFTKLFKYLTMVPQMQWFNLPITSDGYTLLVDIQMPKERLCHNLWSDDWRHSSYAKGELTINSAHQPTVTISVACSKGYHLQVIILLIV